MADAGPIHVIVQTHSGKEAQTIMAQARGYQEIVALLTGHADRDPASFLGEVKVISQRQAERGA